MTSRARAWIAAGAAALLAVPLGITATTAAWTESEWAHGTVGTASLDCGETEGFAATSSGRFLSGSLLGQDLDPLAELTPMRLGLDGAEALTVAPTSALDLGSAAPAYTYANPLNISALGGIAGLDLTGLQVGLPAGTLGAVNQYARVSAYGDAVGASGLVNDSGGVLVTSSTPDDQLPEPARIGLSTLLPAVAGIADARLEVGAVAASSQLDGCAALRSAIWGDGTVTGITRDYGIAGLGLEIDAPAVSGLVGTVNSGVASIGTAVGSLLGPTGLISNAIGARLDAAVPGVLVTSVTGDVTMSGLDLAGSVANLLNTPLTDGVVTVDLASGTIDVDLDALLPSLNDAPPNTQVVLDAAVLAPIVTRLGVLLNTWTSQIVAALTQELRDATLTIDLSALVRALPIAILAPTGLDILNISVDYVGQVGAVLDGTATLAVDAEAAGAISTINTLLTALGFPSVAQLISTVEGLTAVLTTIVGNLIRTTAVSAITSLGTTLSTAVTGIISSVGGVVGALPSVLSVMVNVQPDGPGAPPGSAFVAGTAEATPQYVVSALRIGLADAATPANVAHVVFGTASAGPVTAP